MGDSSILCACGAASIPPQSPALPSSRAVLRPQTKTGGSGLSNGGTGGERGISQRTAFPAHLAQYLAKRAGPDRSISPALPISGEWAAAYDLGWATVGPNITAPTRTEAMRWREGSVLCDVGINDTYDGEKKGAVMIDESSSLFNHHEARCVSDVGVKSDPQRESQWRWRRAAGPGPREAGRHGSPQ